MTTTTAQEPARRIMRPAAGVAIDPARLTWWRQLRGMSRQDLSDRLARMWIDGRGDALPYSHRRARLLPDRTVPVVRWWAPDGKHEQAYPSHEDAARAVAELNAPLAGHRVVPVPGDRRAGCAVCGRPVTGGLTRDSLAKFENPDPAKRRRPKDRTVRALCAALSGCGLKVRPADLMPGGPALPPVAGALEREARLAVNEGMRELADALGRPELYRNPRGRIFYRGELRRMWAQYQAGREPGAVTLARP